MSKILAFISYGVNAGVMLAVSLLLNRTLAPGEYSRYSFAVATTQIVQVFVFEWVRMAAARHYPGPNPADSPQLRRAFIGGQHMLGVCSIVLAGGIALVTSDFYWVLIAAYAITMGLLALQLTMLRFDAQIMLFSKLQTFRAFASLLLIVSAALYFGRGSAALAGGILANALTIAALESIQSGYIFVWPSRSYITPLRQFAWYGVSAATAGGLFQAGPFLSRCCAFRGSSDVSYAAFSLVADLMQRPYFLILDAANGVFFPDAVREQDQVSKSDRSALRLLYAVQVWCLLMIFGCAIAFQDDLLPLLVKADILPPVLEVFTLLTIFFLVHTAIQYTCSLTLHLTRSGLQLIIQSVLELSCIAIMTSLWMVYLKPGISSAAYGGLLGTLFGFFFTIGLLATGVWRSVPCQLPWKSWIAACITALLLIAIGQADVFYIGEGHERLMRLFFKALIACPIILIGGYFGFVIPFGLVKRLDR